MCICKGGYAILQDGEAKDMKKTTTKNMKEEILEELSQQVVRKDKFWRDIDDAVSEIDERITKMTKKGKVPKVNINELEPKERKIIGEISNLLNELKFLSGEANADYMIDCWLDIKAKYSKLSDDAKSIIMPEIKKTIKPIGKQFKI